VFSAPFTVNFALRRGMRERGRAASNSSQAFGIAGFTVETTMADDKMPPVAVTQLKDVRIVEFQNHKILDEGNIADIGATLNAMIEELHPPKMVLDFVNVDHLSSAALGMLINANNKIKQKNGSLRLTNIKPQILEVFVITKLNKLFKILPTREEALASI
jgi:anti-sigma B factor antagonist